MDRLKKYIKGKEGFTLLELMVSLAIMSFGMLGVIAMFVYAMGGNAQGRNLSLATSLASKKIEELKLTPFKDLTSHRTSGTYAPAKDGIFTISDWTRQEPGLNMRKATVSVTWNVKGASWENSTSIVAHKVTLSSAIAKQ